MKLIILAIIQFLLTCVLLQTIKITPVVDENGVTFVRLNEKRIIERYNKILHIVNMTQYQEIVETITQNVLSLDPEPNHKKWLTKEIKNLKDKIKILSPSLYKQKRMSRGLINVLGNTLKFITGTMDNEDAAEIYKHLENLDLNSKQIIEQSNKQIAINDNLIKSVNEISEHVNSEKRLIEDYLSRITNQTTKIFKAEKVLEIYNDISTLEKFLSKFEDIVLLSKLDVLAHDILTNDEILKYNIGIESMPFIKNNVIFENNIIIFVISIPVFTQEKYFTTLIIPSPNSKKEQLDVEIIKVIVNKKEIYEYQEQVQKRKTLKYHSNTCIRNLLKENNTCHFKINNLEKIVEINEEIVVLNNFPKVKIIQNCIDQEIFVKDNVIIKFNNCKISINNLNFSNIREENKENIVIPLLIKTNLTKIVTNFTLREIHSVVTKNQKSIEYIKFESNKTLYYNIGSVTIISILIAIIITIILIKLKLCLKLKVMQNNELKNVKEDNENVELHTIDPFSKS